MLIGYSMTLFQSLATSAGFDPARGPGSSCLGADSSGQCVLPWGSGTKSISSIVLVANGLSFAVSDFSDLNKRPALTVLILTGYDADIYDHWISGRLRKFRQISVPYDDRDMLDCSVCER